MERLGSRNNLGDQRGQAVQTVGPRPGGSEGGSPHSGWGRGGVTGKRLPKAPKTRPVNTVSRKEKESL